MTVARPVATWPANGRDAYIDLLRAFGVAALVSWHWAFTIIRWNPLTGPTAISPVGLTPGFWLATWVLQATPLLFYVGGYAHLRSWERARASGIGLPSFLGRRLRRLALPGLGVLVVWLLLALGGSSFGFTWAARVVRLVVSPLWFLSVYLALVALLPLTLWLHRRYGVAVLPWLAGLAVCVDVLRFVYHIDQAAWANLLIVWGLAHQAGFGHRAIVDAGRRCAWTLLVSGLAGLAVAIVVFDYPASMVGVMGDRFSNMAPPTFAVVALAAVQIGIAAVLRPLGERLLTRPHWTTVIAAMNRYAFSLFLLHATGMAIARSLAVLVLDGDLEDGVPPSLGWWLARPVAVLGAAACTLPLIWLYTRVRPSRVDSARHRRPELAPRLAPLPIPAQRTSAETERGRPVTVVAGGERTQNPG